MQEGAGIRPGYRQATASDAVAIAAVHADSWRRNYRGAYTDEYLDGDVNAERLSVWTGRFDAARATERTIVADLGGEVVGFAHTALDDDPTWGALLDNLHVVHGLKRRGIGAGLMDAVAALVLEARPSSGLYLWVLEQNVAAQGFYAARGGTCVGRELSSPFPGGGRAPKLRYAWPDPRTLLSQVRGD